MKITSQQVFAMQEIMQRQDRKNRSENEDFAATLSKTTDKEELDKKVEKNITDKDVDTFIDNLTNMGASAFWLKFNYEKIQDKINEKRDELMEKLGLDEEDLKNRSTSKDIAKLDAIEELEKLLEEYIKELNAKAQKDKELKNPNSQLNILLNS